MSRPDRYNTRGVNGHLVLVNGTDEMTELSFTIRLCEPDDTTRIVPLIQAQVAASGRYAPDPDQLAELLSLIHI